VAQHDDEAKKRAEAEQAVLQLSKGNEPRPSAVMNIARVASQQPRSLDGVLGRLNTGQRRRLAELARGLADEERDDSPALRALTEEVDVAPYELRIFEGANGIQFGSVYAKEPDADRYAGKTVSRTLGRAGRDLVVQEAMSTAKNDRDSQGKRASPGVEPKGRPLLETLPLSPPLI
jgi:hypothetical protein